MKSAVLRTGIYLALSAICWGQTTFPSSSGITGSTTNTPSPYPSNITVSGLSGTISKVEVRFRGFTAPSDNPPADLDMLLVGPGGQKFLIMSDSGRATAVSNITF